MTRSLYDQLAHGLSGVIADVREKLVEEAWFGRTSASQERMTEAIQDRYAGTQAGPQPTPWDEVCAKMARAHGSEPEHTPDHVKGMER